MAVNGVSGSNNNNSTGANQAATKAAKNILGKDDFLKLMITQLKYQDPLEPTDNKDFIAQMAQFSSLEQMNNMATGFEKLVTGQDSVLREAAIGQALNLIGRKISAVMPTDPETGTVPDVLTGIVTGMKLIDNVPNVIVNGKPIPISFIEEVNL
jgi:flagellar basal-body rod modification protein FlgD